MSKLSLTDNISMIIIKTGDKMTPQPQWQEVLEKVQKENRALREANSRLIEEQNAKKEIQHGLVYKTVPEQGDAQKLIKGCIPLFKNIPELSVKRDASFNDHLLIEGDNLSGLIALQHSHRGRVNVVYIDPPYNTGRDFVYNDKYVADDDSFRHAKWLSFMKPRLELARELMSEDAVIFISIDDNEYAGLKLLMDEIFGIKNFVSNIVWQSTAGSNMGKNIVTTTEYILTYQKSTKTRLTGTKFVRPASMKLQDEHFAERGYYALDKLDSKRQASHYSESLNYSITAPDGTTIYAGEAEENNGFNWLWSKTKVAWGQENDFIVFKKVGKKWNVYNKRYEKVNNKGEQVERTHVFKNFIPSSSYTNAKGTTEVKNMGIQFDYPKPVGLLKDLISLYAGKDAIVLDFFAGSGTTGHAVIELNAEEDYGSRQAVLVTNNFEQDGSPNGIARDVTAERLKRIITGKGWADNKMHARLDENLQYFEIILKTCDTVGTDEADYNGIDSILSEDFEKVSDCEVQCQMMVDYVETVDEAVSALVISGSLVKVSESAAV